MLEKLHRFDTFFIHRYTFIKYRPTSTRGGKKKFLSCEVLPFFNVYFYYALEGTLAGVLKSHRLSLK